MRGIRSYGWVVLTVGGFVLLSAAIRRPDRNCPTPYRLSYPAYFGNRINIASENPMTVEGVELGRRLFYDKRLSANNTIACGSCHQQRHGFADIRAFSLGFDGTPTRRNAMSLTNLLWVRHFFWDGRASSLEAQAITPMTDPHEMGQSPDHAAGKLRAVPGYAALFAAAFGSDSVTGERIVKALAQFERTLISDHSRYDRYIRGEYRLTSSEQQGLTLFFTNNDPVRGIRGAGCGNCHSGPKVFSETYHNNGLDSLPTDPGRLGVTGMEYDRGRFRVVTLRNIALTAPYMHDGRFRNLAEVLDHYSEHILPGPTLSPSLRDSLNRPIELHLTSVEKGNLLAFLNMLTDSVFITDPRYADPFAIKTKTVE
ncbi:MAG TPA: cytochrome c peroxidase [Puia sp.]|nr:cytochrome c peroxidase [Puia sp.]